MREHMRDLRLLPALVLMVGGVLGGLVACPPIRGYPGLERPKEEIALVSVSTSYINQGRSGWESVRDFRDQSAPGESSL